MQLRHLGAGMLLRPGERLVGGPGMPQSLRPAHSQGKSPPASGEKYLSSSVQNGSLNVGFLLKRRCFPSA